MRNTYFKDHEWNRPPAAVLEERDNNLYGPYTKRIVKTFWKPNKQKTKMSRKELSLIKKIALRFIRELKYNRNYRLRKISLFYGRIHAFDVDAVKNMAKKYKFVLERECLYQIFENQGRKFEMWKRKGAFWGSSKNNNSRDHLLDRPEIYPNEIDVFSRNSKSAIHRSHGQIVIRKSAIPDLKYSDRILRLEGKTLLILRFLLKKGCDPNETVFLENMIFKYKWHSKIFFLKIFEMCIKYGLNDFKLKKVLRKGHSNRNRRAFYLYPANPRGNQLTVKDTVQICNGWINSIRFDRMLQNSKKDSNIHRLNDDVISNIRSFLYEPLNSYNISREIGY